MKIDACLSRLIVCALFTFAFGTAAHAQTDSIVPGENFHVEFDVLWWHPSPDLTVNTGRLESVGITDFEFASTFGIEEVWFSDFRFLYRPARKHRIRFGYSPTRYEESAVLTREIRFDDKPFTGTVAADVRWSLWRVGYQWDFISRDRTFIGVFGEVKYNRVHASVRANGQGAVLESDAPAPTIGVNGRFYPHRHVAVAGEFAVFKYTGGDFDGTFFDLDVSATASITKNLGFQGGYRAVTADYFVDPDSADLTLKGVYVGFVSRF